MMLDGSTLPEQTARAASLGVRVALTWREDRGYRLPDPPGYDVPVRGAVDSWDDLWDRIGGRPAGPSCPTCDDGMLTIEHPLRCRECTRSGL